MIVRPRILYKILTSNRKVLTENNFPELCQMIPFHHQPTFLATPGEQSHPTQPFKFHMEVVLSLARHFAHKAVPYLSTMHFDVIIRT